MNLAELQKESRVLAKAKGYLIADWKFGDLIADGHSLLSNALESYRNEEWLPDTRPGIISGLQGPLAEVVIHVAYMAERYQVSLEPNTYHRSIVSIWAQAGVETRSFGEWITLAHVFLTGAYDLRQGARMMPHSSWLEQLIYLYLWIEAMFIHYGMDLDAAIKAKMECYRTNATAIS